MSSAVDAVSNVVRGLAETVGLRSRDEPDMPDPARPDRPDPEEGVEKREEARAKEEDRERTKRQTKMRAALTPQKSLFDTLGQAQRDRDTLG